MLSEKLRALMKAERLNTSRHTSKLLKRYSLPEFLEGSGHSFQVDLDVPKFQWLENGKPTDGGPVQVIGSFVPEDSSWVWGKDNKSIPMKGHDQLSPKINRFFEVLAEKEITPQTDMEAFDLSAFLAAHHGWMGPYIAPTEKGGFVYLAVKIALKGKESAEVSDSLWCTFCGRTPGESPMEPFAPGFALCKECVELSSEIYEMENKDLDKPSPDFVPPCLVCGKQEKVIAGDYAAIGFKCVPKLRAALGMPALLTVVK